MKHSQIYLDKKLNRSNAAEYKDKLIGIISKNDITILSFKNVIYLDKWGLKIIVELLEYSKKQNRELRLCELKPEIKEILSFTSLSSLFKIYNTPQEALG